MKQNLDAKNGTKYIENKIGRKYLWRHKFG